MHSSEDSRPSERRPRTQAHRQLVGIGLDGNEGEKRVTKGEDFVLMGGSRETHEIMQDLVIRMEEKLKRKGKRMGELGDPDDPQRTEDRAGDRTQPADDGHDDHSYGCRRRELLRR